VFLNFVLGNGFRDGFRIVNGFGKIGMGYKNQTEKSGLFLDLKNFPKCSFSTSVKTNYQPII